jgi:hypothetical protein
MSRRWRWQKNGLVAGTGGITVEAAMKTLPVIVLAMLAVASTQADTNIIAVLTTADGISYTNARIDHITPVYVDVWYDSGIVHIALTNLPEALQKQYPYDTNTAAQFLAAEKQKAADRRAAEIAAVAQRQAWLEQQATNAGYIYVVYRDPITRQYTAAINGGRQKIYLNNPPNGLDSAVDWYAMKYISAESDYIFSSIKGDKVGETIALDNGRAVQENLIPCVRAFNTGTFYNGIPVWQFVAKDK